MDGIVTIPKYVMLPLLTHAEWIAEGERRFGGDQLKWRFVCPGCGHVAAVEDWKRVGAASWDAGVSCIGRWIPNAREFLGGTGPGPCNYSGGGLFGLNPQPVACGSDQVLHVFAFADETASGPGGGA